METQFDVLRTNRSLVAKIIKDIPLDKLHTTPEGFNNHIAWNVAHLVVTQQLLNYKLSDKDCLIPDELIEGYRKGTFPGEDFTAEEWQQVLDLFLGLPDTLEEDYKDDLFKTYTEYPTSTGFVLTDIDTAIAFNNYHEGIHLGIILSLSKLV